ncbi:MAG: hypothetical protein M0Q02_02565, partial [Candidatus Muirbacterium halophilum]|nr:hypothetical protein [Candidatus Muirbacterium halophilum]
DVINCSVSGTITASGAGEAGGLIGKAGAGLTITNSSTDINITGQLVGGLVGNSEADITSCHSAGTVTQTGNYEAGGLIGILKDADLTSSYSTANVNGYRLVGGLVGWVDSFAKDILIEFCYATGNVSVNTTTSGGGLIALVQNTGETTTVRNCYATGNLTGSNCFSQLGGLIGKWADNEGSIINCYSIGHLSNADNLGGLISSNVGGATITSSYWDTVTSGQASSSGGGTGKTTVEMKTESTFTDAGWDFTTIWNIDGVTNNGYPFLR